MSRNVYSGVTKSGKTTEVMKKLSETYLDAGGDILPGVRKSYKFIAIIPSWDTNDAINVMNPGVKNLFKQDDIYYNFSERTLDLISRKISQTDKEVILVVDDLGRECGSRKQNNIITKIAVLGAHGNVHLYLLVQRLTMANPDTRANVDTLTIYKTMSRGERRILRDEFFPDLNDEEFKDLLSNVFKKRYDRLTVSREKGGIVKYYRNDKEIQPEKYF